MGDLRPHLLDLIMLQELNAVLNTLCNSTSNGHFVASHCRTVPRKLQRRPWQSAMTIALLSPIKTTKVNFFNAVYDMTTYLNQKLNCFALVTECR